MRSCFIQFAYGNRRYVFRTYFQFFSQEKDCPCDQVRLLQTSLYRHGVFRVHGEHKVQLQLTVVGVGAFLLELDLHC